MCAYELAKHLVHGELSTPVCKIHFLHILRESSPESKRNERDVLCKYIERCKGNQRDT